MVYQITLNDDSKYTSVSEDNAVASALKLFINDECSHAISIEIPGTDTDDSDGEFVEVWSRANGFDDEAVKSLGIEAHVSFLR